MQILYKTQVSRTTVFSPFRKLCFFSLCRLLCSDDFISMTTIHFWSSVFRKLMLHTASFKSVLIYYCHHLAATFDAYKGPSGAPLPHQTCNFPVSFQKSDGKTNVWLFLSISPLAQIQTDSWATEIIFSHGSHCDPGSMSLFPATCQLFFLFLNVEGGSHLLAWNKIRRIHKFMFLVKWNSRK